MSVEEARLTLRAASAWSASISLAVPTTRGEPRLPAFILRRPAPCHYVRKAGPESAHETCWQSV